MDHIQAFREAIASFGIVPPEHIKDDGRRHRFPSNGIKGDDSGWYILHGDERPAGVFGCWRMQISEKWKHDSKREFTPAEREAWKKRMQDLEAAREKERQEAVAYAAKSAEYFWNEGTQREHPYLTKKGIPGVGTRVTGGKYPKGHELEGQACPVLLVPVRGPGKKLIGLQRIFPDGYKRFLKGTPIDVGGYCRIGDLTPTMVICEGYATGESIHMATGFGVVIAFNAGNLQRVAHAMQQLVPSVQWVIGADDDKFTVYPERHPKAGQPWNPGMEAAAATGLPVAIPLWAGERDRGTDFNDLHLAEGLDAVRACFEDPQPIRPEPEHRDEIDPDTGEIMGEEPPDFDRGWENPIPEAPVFHMPPLDVFKETPVPVLDPAMVPPQIAAFAYDQAELLGVDPAMIAIPALAACAAVIHDGVQIQPKRHETSWRESARIWCAVVGDPSVRKSPSLKRAVSRLKKINKELCEDNEKKQAAYAAKVDEYRKEKKAAERSGDIQPCPPEEPRKERLVVEDTTVEALADILKHNERGVLCLQDELTGWFGSMDAYNGGKATNKDRAHWLEAYNGGHRMVDRKLSGAVSIPNFSVCMLGGIQPDMMRRIAASMGEDGLMQRFIVINGRNTGREVDRQEDEAAKRAYGDLIDSLYAIQPGADPVLLSEGAHLVRERVTSFAAEVIAYGAIQGGLRSHLGKWTGLFARLLLIYHCIECISARKHPNSRPVSAETAERVEQLMTRFLMAHALSFYADVMSESSDLQHIRWIAGFILAGQRTTISNREITQAYREWRGIDEWRRGRIMQALEDYGWIQPANEIQRRRRRVIEWVVNDKAHETFAVQADTEAKRRAKVRDMMQALGR